MFICRNVVVPHLAFLVMFKNRKYTGMYDLIMKVFLKEMLLHFRRRFYVILSFEFKAF